MNSRLSLDKCYFPYKIVMWPFSTTIAYSSLWYYLTMKQRNSNIYKCSKVANDSAWKWSQYSSNIHAEVKYHTNLVEIDMKQQIS